MMSASVEPEIGHLLVIKARDGDRPAADRLVREHDGWLRSVLFGITGRPQYVDDLAQQVWTQVWERLGSLKDPRRLRSWLYTIARNAAIDAGMARKRRATGHLDAMADQIPTDGRADPRVASIDGELQETLLRAVESLPALYREPFVLRHLEDWSYAEIGALLKLPVETVETRLVRARRMLREMLKGRIEP